jgi:hypothetical protein
MLHGTFAAPPNQVLKLGAVLNLAEFAPSIEVLLWMNGIHTII